MKYKIRNFCIKDLKSFAQMLGETWDLGKRTTDAGKICNWVYAFEVLRTSSETIVLVDKDDRPVGFAGYNQKKSRRKWLKRTIYCAAYHISFVFIKKRSALRAYYNTYDYVPDHVKKEFDAEVSILVVDQKIRGLGLGKVIFDEIAKRAKESGAKNLQIDTDESCSIGFYKKDGCKEVYKSKAGKAGEAYTENVYVFGKNLK